MKTLIKIGIICALCDLAFVLGKGRALQAMDSDDTAGEVIDALSNADGWRCKFIAKVAKSGK